MLLGEPDRRQVYDPGQRSGDAMRASPSFYYVIDLSSVGREDGLIDPDESNKSDIIIALVNGLSLARPTAAPLPACPERATRKLHVQPGSHMTSTPRSRCPCVS